MKAHLLTFRKRVLQVMIISLVAFFMDLLIVWMSHDDTIWMGEAIEVIGSVIFGPLVGFFAAFLNCTVSDYLTYHSFDYIFVDALEAVAVALIGAIFRKLNRDEDRFGIRQIVIFNFVQILVNVAVLYLSSAPVAMFAFGFIVNDWSKEDILTDMATLRDNTFSACVSVALIGTCLLALCIFIRRKLREKGSVSAALRSIFKQTLLKKEYGEDFHTLYQISPAGCQSPRDLVRHYTTEPDFWHEDGVTEIANRLLTAVRAAVPGKIDYSPVFEAKTIRVSLPRRRATYQAYKAAKAELARLLAIQNEDDAHAEFCDRTHAAEKLGGPGPYDDKTDHYVCIKNEQAVITRYESQDEVPTISFDMLVARLGDVAIANNPFELYLYYGQNIKARSRAQQTFLVQLSSGASLAAGYLPSPAAEKFGGYGGMIINGQCGSDAGFMLADRTVDEINRLFA